MELVNRVFQTLLISFLTHSEHLAHELYTVVTFSIIVYGSPCIEAFCLFVKTYRVFLILLGFSKIQSPKRRERWFKRNLDLFASKGIKFIFMKGVCFL